MADKATWVEAAMAAHPGTCWEYPWSSSPRYSNISHMGRKVSAHRLICEMAHGKPSQNQVVRHSCDNAKCCNPHHLSWGSQAENIADAMERGRFALGEAHGRSKLTPAQVAAIRRLHCAGEAMNEIARGFGISRPCVKQIVTRRTWAHVA